MIILVIDVQAKQHAIFQPSCEVASDKGIFQHMHVYKIEESVMIANNQRGAHNDTDTLKLSKMLREEINTLWRPLNSTVQPSDGTLRQITC